MGPKTTFRSFFLFLSFLCNISVGFIITNLVPLSTKTLSLVHQNVKSTRNLKMMSEPQGFVGEGEEDDLNFDLWESGYSSVHVSVSTKAGSEQSFIAASIENAKNSILEPGVSRFDVLQDLENPTKFALLEVYNNPTGGTAHKETAHYSKWRDGVADMMAEPRSAKKYRPIFPTPEMWLTDEKASQNDKPDPQPYYVVMVDIQVKKDFDEGRFIGHTLYNCEQSMQEEGVARFDLLQNEEDPRNFVLLEIYQNEATAAAHKETTHYNVWREEVQILMARPRGSQKFKTIFPSHPHFEWEGDFAAMNIDLDLLDLWDEEQRDFITTAQSVENKKFK